MIHLKGEVMVKRVTKKAASATKRRKAVKSTKAKAAKRSVKKSKKGFFSWF